MIQFTLTLKGTINHYGAKLQFIKFLIFLVPINFLSTKIIFQFFFFTMENHDMLNIMN